MLHDWFGLGPGVQRLADGLCREGFTALAVDLYDGRRAATVEEADALAGSLDRDTTLRRLSGAAEFLRANWHPRVGAVGFSLGAALALKLSPDVGLEAVVAYYSLGDPPERFASPLLLLSAENDEWEPEDEIAPVLRRLEDSGVDVDRRVYAGTGHWFANPDVPRAFDPAAAGEAFAETVEHLRYHLA